MAATDFDLRLDPRSRLNTEGPARRSSAGVWAIGIIVVVVIIAAFVWLRPNNMATSTAPQTSTSQPASTAPNAMAPANTPAPVTTTPTAPSTAPAPATNP